MTKIYVSSTIADLKWERQAVLEWLRAARHQAVDSYLPNSDTVRDSSLDDVGTCELYVLILGHRYGFQPADHNPDGLSITHLEFRRAGQCGIPRIALLRTSIPDVRVSDMEDPAKAALVFAFRAEVAREVRPAEFSDGKGLIQGLSTGVQGEVDRRPAGLVAAGRALRLAPRPVFLAGREELLSRLDALLTGGGDPWPRYVALCGLGGTGKTSVAVEYAYRHLDEVGVVWQLGAEDPTLLAAEFGELAAQLGFREASDTRYLVASVHGVLAASRAGWLLVFDSAPDWRSVEAFLPPAGRGRVLITSQNQKWPPGHVLDVPVLDREVAADFLVNRTGDPDRQAAAVLADELGGLPLALEQAAAYMQATGVSMADYLGSFRQRQDELLRRGAPIGYDKTVATTWTLAFGRLEQSAPSAVGMLRLLACCAPEAIPLSLLFQPLPGLAGRLGPEVAPTLAPLLDDPLAASDAIDALREYSLVIPAGDRSVSVHRLVQAVIAHLRPELADQWRQAAATLIKAAIPGNTDPPDTWPACAALLPHAQVVLAPDSAGMARLANYLGQRGSYAAAVELQRRVRDAWERSPYRERPETLRASADLARWTGQAGDPAAARDQFQELLPEVERALGPEHPDTLRARAGFAGWTGEAGDPGGARDQFKELLPVVERVLGPKHPETLSDRASLARWTGEAGDAPGARDLFDGLLQVRKRALGPEQPDTLRAYAGVAGWTGEAGDPAGARDQFAALLPVVERVLGPKHPETLSDRASLARWTGEAGDEAGARDQFAALLPVRDRELGPRHPDTLNDRANLGHWTGEAGDQAGARDQFKELLPITERALRAEHPVTLRARASLARWTGETGDPAAARDHFRELLPVIGRVLGPEHPETLTARANLAHWTGGAGDPAGARDQFQELLFIRERLLSPEHPDTLIARASVAGWNGEAGDPAGAREEFAALLPIIGRVLGPEHPETLTARASLARWAGEAGDPAGARDQFQELLPITKRVLGPEHPDTLTVRAFLARWTGEAGDPAGAREEFAELLPDVERVLGPGHPDTLITRAFLARWTGEAGDPAGARDQFEPLLPIMERVFGPEHPETLRAARWSSRVTDVN